MNMINIEQGAIILFAVTMIIIFSITIWSIVWRDIHKYDF